MRHHKMIVISLLMCFPFALAGCFGPELSPKSYEAPTGFLLGPEDELEITVWGNKDLTRVTAVRPDGLISMPLIGDVQAAGLTADALAQRIAERLKQYLATTPAVSVSVKELNSYSVYVLGEVAKPGKLQLKSTLRCSRPSRWQEALPTMRRRTNCKLCGSLKMATTNAKKSISRYDTTTSYLGVANRAISYCIPAIRLSFHR